MKKFISFALVLVLCLGLFAGCVEEPVDTTPDETTVPTTEPVTENPLDNAAEYIYTMYKPVSKNEPTKLTADKDMLAAVVIDGVSYPVEWTVEITSGPAEGVVIAESLTANMVKIDVMDQPEEELFYTLTATVKNDKGETKSVSFDYYTPAVQKVEISDNLVVIYNPGDGKYVTDVDYLYTSASSGNQKHELELTTDKASAVVLKIEENDDGSVNIVTESGLYLYCDGNNVQFVAEQGEYTKFFLEAAEGGQYIKSNAIAYDKPQYIEVYSGYLTCYGMNAEKAGLYTFELQTFDGVTQSAILDAAYALGTGEALPEPYTLTGVITKIDTAWSDQYQNITVTIVCGGDTERPMMCYRLKGDGAKDLAEGDTITVTGTIKNYNGTIEFDAGCNLDKVVKAEGNEPSDEPDEPTVPVEAQLPPVTAPAAGTTYKFGLIQVTTGNTVYIAGGIDQDRYLITTTDKAAALDVTIEEVDGGIKIATTIDGEKLYIALFLNADGKTALGYTAEGSVWNFDAERSCWYLNLDGTDYYMGSYNTFETISASKISYINAENSGVNQFPAGFFEAN